MRTGREGNPGQARGQREKAARAQSVRRSELPKFGMAFILEYRGFSPDTRTTFGSACVPATAHQDDAPRMKLLIDYVARIVARVRHPSTLLREVVVPARSVRCVDGRGIRARRPHSDNMNVTGRELDYGPYRFLRVTGRFHGRVLRSAGSLCLRRQPQAVMNNLGRLGESVDAAWRPRASCCRRWRQYEPHLGEALRRRFLARWAWRRSGSTRNATLVVRPSIFIEATAGRLRSVLLRLARRRRERSACSREVRRPSLPRRELRSLPARRSKITRPSTSSDCAHPISNALGRARCSSTR